MYSMYKISKVRLTILMLISILLMSACSQAPKKEKIAEAEYTYIIILKSIAARHAQRFIRGLKNSGSVLNIETIELNNQYAEYRVISIHKSGEIFDVIHTVLADQGQHANVTYIANKFVIGNKS